MSEVTPYTPPASKVQDAEVEFCSLKLFSFQGRIGRIRYLAYSMGVTLLFYLVFGIVVGIATVALPESAQTLVMGLAMTVFVIVVFVFMGMLLVRRLHDLDHSAWMMLILLIPLVGSLFSLYLMFAPGTRGDNRFDNPPPPNHGGVIALALLFPILFVGGIIAAISIPAYQGYMEQARQEQLQQQ